MIGSATACSSGGGNSAAPAQGGTASSGAAKVDTSKHVKISMLVLGDKPTNGRMEAAIAEENKLLTKKVNAELSLQYFGAPVAGISPLLHQFGEIHKRAGIHNGANYLIRVVPVIVENLVIANIRTEHCNILRV